MRRWGLVFFCIALVTIGYLARTELVSILPAWTTRWIAAEDMPEARVAKQDPVRVTVLAVAAESGSLPILRRTIGTVVPLMSTNISTAVPGTIARIFARDGALVKAGDPIVRMDDRVIAASVERHKAMLAMDQAQLDDANETLERVNSLTRTGAESKQQGDDALAAAKQAKAAMEVDQANLAADSALLAQTEINAPFDGQLGAVRLSPGAYVAPGSTIVTLTQMKPVYGEFTLSETDLALARASHAAGKLSAEFSPMLLGDNSVGSAIGPIVFIDNTVDPVSATFKMRALLPNDDETLWPGQSVNVLVDAGTVDNLVLVPLVAIQSLDTGNICYVVKPDQTIEIRNVDVALRVGNNAGIVHGLADGELVVVEGQASLEEGTAVIVQKAKAATSEPAASAPRIVK